MRLWAFARARLGLSDAEFLAMPPVALDALIGCLRDRRREELGNFAALCAELWNSSGFAERQFTAADFLPAEGNVVHDAHDVRDEQSDWTEFARECAAGGQGEPDAVKSFVADLRQRFKFEPGKVVRTAVE